MAETSDIPGETLREWARDDRVTLAIVFTDIVGSTALGRALGDEQMKGVRRAHFGHSRALLAQHAGREIKTIGDSVMAVFRSIGAALDYAHALYLNPGHAALQARGVRRGSYRFGRCGRGRHLRNGSGCRRACCRWDRGLGNMA